MNGGEGVNEDKLSHYIEKYHTTVFRAAYSYVKCREDAEDITQETFLRLYKSDAEFSTDENVKAWLIRVSINLAKDMLKSAWLKGRTELDRDIPCESDKESIMLDCIHRLKPEYCSVILLFYYEGYNVKEIADITKCSPSLVTTRLSRARKQLKTMLLKEGYYEK